MNKRLLFLLKTYYIFINLLFIYKYGLRQSFVPVIALVLGYLLVAGFLSYKDVFSFDLIKRINLKIVYKTLCGLILISIFLVVFFTDGTTLKVDRWSAMDVAIRALLNGDYPYTATDHLNGRTSNFSGLLLVGVPFYLLGNVGYLQVFAFALLSYTLYKTLAINNAFRFIVLLLIAPAYWWEIFAISDLFSNIILVFCFIVLIKYHFKNTIFKYPILLGITTSILVLTRGIVAIPLVLFVFAPFFKIKLSDQIKYSISFATTFIFLIALVLINCPDLETLKNYNPFVLQTAQTPNYIIVLALAAPFYLSFKIKKFNFEFYTITSILIGLVVLISLFYRVYSTGIDDLFYKNSFDLSYLSLVLPFILMTLVNEKKITTETQKS